MIYLYSKLHEMKVRIDSEKDIAFLKDSRGNEMKAEVGNKVVADANLENNLISE